MESLGAELERPAKEITEYGLTGFLDAAVRASSAQYDDPDLIARLRIRLDQATGSETGALNIYTQLRTGYRLFFNPGTLGYPGSLREGLLSCPVCNILRLSSAISELFSICGGWTHCIQCDTYRRLLCLKGICIELPASSVLMLPGLQAGMCSH